MPNPKTKAKSVKISDLYKLYFEYTLHESKAIWDTSQIFLLANTFLATFIGSNIYKNTIEDINHKIMFLAFSFLGFAISVLWLTSVERIKKHYYFRMYQTQLLENDFEMFSGEAEKLAGGGVEKINDKLFDFRLFGLINLSSFNSLRIIIVFFILFYSVLVVLQLNSNTILKPLTSSDTEDDVGIGCYLNQHKSHFCPVNFRERLFQ